MGSMPEHILMPHGCLSGKYILSHLKVHIYQDSREWKDTVGKRKQNNAEVVVSAQLNRTPEANI